MIEMTDERLVQWTKFYIQDLNLGKWPISCVCCGKSLGEISLDDLKVEHLKRFQACDKPKCQEKLTFIILRDA